MSRASDRAYQEIRSRIVTGALGPGAQLKEEELAEVCGVSRTPVRDALRRLEAEMFVRRTDSQRSFVAEWSVSDVDEMFTLRGMLEGHAAARAALRVTDDQLSDLRRHNAAIEAAINARRRPDVQSFLDHNRQFHAIVLDAAGSERLTMMLARLIEQPVVLRTALLYDRDQLMRSFNEHAELLAAFERRDADWAKAVMTGHIRRAFHAYSDTYSRSVDARRH
jgi:DNA-binding GntR family transcriptional regulator